MGKNNTSGRGFSSRAMRALRVEMFRKALNRKNNLNGCSCKAKKKDS
jgi:hypothetical protein